MKTRKLRDLDVSAVGYGCMGLSMGYGAVPEQSEAIRLIRQAYDLGCTFFDTAELYGAGGNEILVGEALQSIRDNIVLATKFLIPTTEQTATREGLLAEIQSHVDASLKRLGTDYIDLYYQHRVNKDIPVEDIAWCMGTLIREGKILGWGQSQSTDEEIRRAHAVTPLTAIQSQYSIMDRMFEKDVIPTCEELGIGFVSFSPLGNGFLSGKYTADTTYTGADVRRVITGSAKKMSWQTSRFWTSLSLLLTKKVLPPHRLLLRGCCTKKSLSCRFPVPETRSESKRI